MDQLRESLQTLSVDDNPLDKGKGSGLDNRAGSEQGQEASTSEKSKPRYDSFFLYILAPDKTNGQCPRQLLFRMGRYRVRREVSYEDMFVETTGASLYQLEGNLPRSTLEKLAMATLKFGAGLRHYQSAWFDKSDQELYSIIQDRSINGLSYGYSLTEIGQMKYKAPSEIMDLLPQFNASAHKSAPPRMSEFWHSEERFKGLYPLGTEHGARNDVALVKKARPLLWNQRQWLMDYLDRKEDPEKYAATHAGSANNWKWEPERDSCGDSETDHDENSDVDDGNGQAASVEGGHKASTTKKAKSKQKAKAKAKKKRRK